jgi:SpoVK/Ycf46/Vps4 family AAA+-type ATPase
MTNRELRSTKSKKTIDFAQRIRRSAGIKNRTISPQVKERLLDISNQYAQNPNFTEGKKTSESVSKPMSMPVLFSGPDSKRKLQAAEVLALKLKLPLYRIDLSHVVSKYIGETEKNLSQLFDAAEDGGAVLFFDEADALFGKRSEVKDSHDRYANIEVNYLLERLESYKGLAILATNSKSAIDPAFIRRLKFIVDFPFPSVKQREMEWRKRFPKKEKLEF